ncbi:hypothetical protein JCM19233_1962 [Vibrio astriarenae]|nr:hypothetical protein JCM19233_1962 [Vibrio sp. C7]
MSSKRKVFISYKYGDSNVKKLNNIYDTKVRDYVDKLQSLLEAKNHINKGEADGEDLSDFADSTIASKLRDKIYDSSVTIVVISKGMKEPKPDSEQWIPWEVSYSLKESTRNDRTSQSNGVLGVVIPDKNGSYNYFLERSNCGGCACRTIKNTNTFSILRENMFNIKHPTKQKCQYGKDVYTGESSYIAVVEWEKFYENIDFYIDNANNRRKNN